MPAQLRISGKGSRSQSAIGMGKAVLAYVKLFRSKMLEGCALPFSSSKIELCLFSLLRVHGVHFAVCWGWNQTRESPFIQWVLSRRPSLSLCLAPKGHHPSPSNRRLLVKEVAGLKHALEDDSPDVAVRQVCHRVFLFNLDAIAGSVRLRRGVTGTSIRKLT